MTAPDPLPPLVLAWRAWLAEGHPPSALDRRTAALRQALLADGRWRDVYR